MLILYGLLSVAVIMDLRSMRISNRLILIGLGIALVRRVICDGMQGVLTGVFLISFPVIILYLLFLAGALGAGDIKLFSLIGGFVNFKELIWCMIYAFIFAALLSLAKMLYHRTFFVSMKSVILYFNEMLMGNLHPYETTRGNVQKIHFSVAVLVGVIVVQIKSM